MDRLPFYISIIIVSLSLLSGCLDNKPVCNKPYILVGNDCCLDLNDNGICDRDETTTTTSATTTTTSSTTTTILRAEQIRDKSIDAMGEVETYAFNVVTRTETETYESSRITKGKTDLKNKKMYMEIKEMYAGTKSADVIERNTSIYIINNIRYRKIPIFEWVKDKMSTDIWEQNYAKSQIDLMKNSEVKLLDDEKVDERDCYVLEIRYNPENIFETSAQWTLENMAQIPYKINLTVGELGRAIAKILKVMEIRAWIAKDTFLIVKIHMEIGNETGKMSTTMRFYDYNKPVEITLPSEAENAKDIESMVWVWKKQKEIPCESWDECMVISALIGLDKTRVRCIREDNIEKCKVTVIESSTANTTVKETCYDGIRNQDEIGVDCGGSCMSCSDKACEELWEELSEIPSEGKTMCITNKRSGWYNAYVFTLERVDPDCIITIKKPDGTIASLAISDLYPTPFDDMEIMKVGDYFSYVYTTEGDVIGILIHIKDIY